MGTQPAASQSTCTACAPVLRSVDCRLSTFVVCHKHSVSVMLIPFSEWLVSTSSTVCECVSDRCWYALATHSCTALVPLLCRRTAGLCASPLPKPGNTGLPSRRSMLAGLCRRSAAALHCVDKWCVAIGAPKCRHTGICPSSYSMRTHRCAFSSRRSVCIKNQPLVAPMVRPAMKCFCIKKKMSTGGMAATMEPADTKCH